MGWLNVEKPPDKWSSSYFKMFVERVRTALNYLDSENFPDGMSGLWLRDRTVPLYSKGTGYGGLVISHDFFSQATGVSVTATTLTSYGAPVLWAPQWARFARAYLEVTCNVANASYPGTVEVHSVNGLACSATCSSTAVERIEVLIEDVPTEDSTLIFKARAAHASYPLTILSARIILKLSESVGITT